MKEALLKMHFAVFLWGFTGVLGRVIELQAFPLVLYRMLLSAICFFIILYFQKKLIPISRKEIIRFSVIGSVIAIHWCCFYGSIKFANASIALVCLSTAGIFTAIIEPLVMKTKFEPKQLTTGFIALLGMYFIYKFEFEYATGIILGIIAALLSTIFTIMNKKIINHYEAKNVAFYEIGFGFLFLLLLLPLYQNYFPTVSFAPTLNDWFWLFILSFFCTVLGQSFALEALKKISSFTAVLLVNLEPVYGIILAILIYKENKELGWGFVLGILLIAFSVFVHSWQMANERKSKKS
ncbi:MAG: EamA family transporter [Chitinophagaceae bacterium]|nr:EamA family transporter [Chitinophagaceae bacterium]